MFNQAVFLNPQAIKDGLSNPYHVIHEALDQDFADQLYNDLVIFDNWSTDNEKTYQGDGVPELQSDYSYSRKSIFINAPEAPPSLSELDAYLNSPACLNWMTGITGRKCDVFVGSATRFGPGDHITRHNDNLTVTKPDGSTQRRVVAINYWLSKNWGPDWGGEFVWETPRAEISPTFNTLIMFLPGPTTHHWVTPVSEAASEPRISITGWYHTIYEKSTPRLKLNLD